MRRSSGTAVIPGDGQLPVPVGGDHEGDLSSADRGNAAQIRLWRYLPLVLVSTAALTVLPVEVALALVPGTHGLFTMLGSAAVALAIAMLAAQLGAAAWKRRRQSRDLVFSELILWGWGRRCLTEWRLRRARAQYESAARASPQLSIELLERVSRLLQDRDPYTHGHSRRVARHSVRIARAMRLPAAQVAKIRAAACIHDVGKLYTPRAILNNPGRLSDEEYEIVKRHAADGAAMIGPAGDREITAMVRHHHERLSGDGYPDGLAGEQIPVGARIIAVADTFDAITSTRSYRKASSHKRALDILRKEAGTQLDAGAVSAFLRSYSARRTVAWTALAMAVPQRALAWLQASGAGVGIGAGSLPQVLPVVGAAGALALAPGHARHRTQARGTAARAAVVHAGGAPASRGFVRAAGTGKAPSRRASAPGPTASTGRPLATPRSRPPRNAAPRHAADGGSGTSQTSSTASTPSAPTGSRPGSGGSPSPPPAPAEQPTPVPVPTVSTPSVPAPPVTVPEVAGVKASSEGVSVKAGSALSVEAGV
jgi:HD-GYP domain-containing protein (c-di-GMP phosphodiesterase class II)